MDRSKSILWVDDEIDLLRPHIILLQQRGYMVETATNGEDALTLAQSNHYGLVFLDESMVGMSGLDTLLGLKLQDASRPVVMVTKNEQESIMDEAIGRKIDDYLTKPVNPAQILAACKKFLEAKKIVEQKFTQTYFQGFNEISQRLNDNLTWNDWLDIYQKLVGWSMELDTHPELGFAQTLNDQWRECNRIFSRFVEKNYADWLTDKPKEGNPLLSPHILDEFVLPRVKKAKHTIFFVVDCMRLDQWLVMEEFLRPLFNVTKSYYSGILPTATPYARNSIFSGLYPADIAKHYPQWAPDESRDEHSQNAHEKDLLGAYLKRKFVELNNDLQYIKIIDTDFGKKIENDITRIAKNHFTAVVVNAMDMIAHSRSDYAILKEIAPDESAYRSLTRSWFQHSSLYGMLRTLAGMKDVNIVITTDHGSVRCLHGVKALGDRDTSTCLRYKMGRNVKADDKNAMQIKNPAQYRLPQTSMTTNMIIAKEDYYFVYPTDFNHYLSKYRDSFQHGGISLEEMILPVVILEQR
ncbi:MAG: bifunctional response regulator/alkaline phosphatase family protein [Candidatus Kapabacteria bacterium]|nr:bifunctional response regulator/alkaline phosphatase family protein [Candidatus Kapabacteria bacterium]